MKNKTTINLFRNHAFTCAALGVCAMQQAGAEYHVSVSGNDANAGSVASPFKTISKAADLAQPGEVITVHEGVYRERINPPRGGTSDEKRIVYQAAPGEQVVIKGSERITDWKQVDETTWTVTLPNSFFGGYNPYGDLVRGDWYEARRPYHTGAVYLNGHWLKEAARKDQVVKAASGDASGDARPELMNLKQLAGGGKNSETLPASKYQTASEKIPSMDLPDGQNCVGRVKDGVALTYDIDFGEEARNMTLFAASPIEGGLVEIRKDNADGELLGTFDVYFTAGWTSFQPFQANLSLPLSGKQTIALVFKERPAPAWVDANEAKWFAEVGAETTTIWAQFKDVDPNKELVEINVRQSVFYPGNPGMNYLTVRGFTLEQAATPWAPPTAEQIGLLGTHWSKGWLIENNTVRYSTCAGVTLGKGRDSYDSKGDYHSTIRVSTENGWNRETVGSHVVRNNHIHDCGQAGICGSLGCSFSTIVGNEIHDIKKHHEYFGCEAAGIKLHGFVDGLIKDNHIYRCEHWGGLWLDWMAQGVRVTGNLMHDNSQDMMFEVNHGPFLVDHNLLLSRTGVTKVSSSGAYAHNLWFGNIQLWPTEQRQTPFMESHSTEIVNAEALINQSDDRYYNNIFVGAKGTSALDEHGFSLTGTGNVFLAGAVPSKHEQNAVAAKEFDPQIELTKEPDGWWLKMKVDPAWDSVRRNLVTTDLLGVAAVTGAPYEQGDGKPYLLDTDYFGNKWPENHPSPGVIPLTGVEEIRVKVWPKSKE
ncbi:MAG: carbohydrate-binding protein [Verrucomicrobia bacterium]|nr:carbohydrate-binding protein [Verrucomicrobiota bacterium]